MKRILITGAGGPAAISFMKAIKDQPFEVHMADMSHLAAGLFLVPPERRICIPAGRDPLLVNALLVECVKRRIDVLVPTVDAELHAMAGAEARFKEVGVRILVSSAESLALCLDKFALARACEGVIDVPKTELFEDPAAFERWAFPLIIKPRAGSGSRGVRLIRTFSELAAIPPSSELIVQEFLPGTEYSVDVLADTTGVVRAAVPRERMLVDSGVAVVSRTVRDDGLMRAAARVAAAVGITHIANVQLKRRADGTPALLEINPRTPGTMPLTVASGINMPSLALAAVLGSPALYPLTPFKELAVVRYLEEQFIHPSELEVPRVSPNLVADHKVAASQ